MEDTTDPTAMVSIDPGPCRNRPPDLIHLLICHRHTAVGPIEREM
jgi:hypothetical protein